MRNERAWPQQCWKSAANGSNIVELRFGGHGTKEMLGVVGWKVWPVKKIVNCKLLLYPRSTKEFMWTRLNVSVRSRSNWNFEVLVFEVSNLAQQLPTTRNNVQQGNLRSGSIFVSFCKGRRKRECTRTAKIRPDLRLAIGCVNESSM